MNNTATSRGCMQCPRRCGVNRAAGEYGVCGAPHEIHVAKIMLHPWEEPCLQAEPGSGAIFFTGCPLRCVYCQNRPISRPREAGGNPGKAYTPQALASCMLELQAQGAANIDLVSPTQYAEKILSALSLVKDRLTIPVVWNTGGYETPETVARCAGLVDIFLTDFKYGTASFAEKYSAAPDYPAVAEAALRMMTTVAGPPRMRGGQLLSGVIVRHLVLPGGRHDSIAALRRIADTVSPDTVILSLMRQYTPDFAPKTVRALTRRVTTFEYESVRAAALSLGFTGYGQDADSASCAYTPDFSDTSFSERDS